MFKALVLEEINGQVTPSVKELDDSALPEGDVLVGVEYSTLNYKDGMVMNGIGRLVRTYPHVPGVDFAGRVLESTHADFKEGDAVVMGGWRVGENRFGGYAEKARVNGDWLVKLPHEYSTRDAMGLGTAGVSAMIAIQALEDQGLSPDAGEVLVTGAAGGVGSVAVALLGALGYDVAAVTGRAETADYLRALGAKTIVSREELSVPPDRPLNKERWAGCVDNVGGVMLAAVLSQMQYGSSIAAVGLAGGNEITTTVLPFLLRAVNILGIDSVMYPTPKRQRAWQRIVETLDRGALESMINEVTLESLPALSRQILKGSVQGRTVIKIAQ